ncbi:MAG: hypothetical protein LBT05_11345 [Planctomycetaceae bacterium]|jgi:hypothetical protein|nr:hypothetical protein [Planctomycetaceae bacterium]
MKKHDYQTLPLNKGKIMLYDFGMMRLHVYQTNDLMNDMAFILEKKGHGIILEPPYFFENMKELKTYLDLLNLQLDGVVTAYHLTGLFLPQAERRATKKVVEDGQREDDQNMADNFAVTFEKVFDKNIFQIKYFFKTGTTTLGGIKMNIQETAEAFDVEFPEINAIYIHMLGHDCHSIVTGKKQAEEMISRLKNCLQKRYDLILTSHYVPEDLFDAKTKIHYLETLLILAEKSASAEEFQTSMQKKYPQYDGEDYLEMTANFFFPKKHTCRQTISKNQMDELKL